MKILRAAANLATIDGLEGITIGSLAAPGRKAPSRSASRRSSAEWGSNVTRLVRDAQAAGSLPSGDDPAQVAFELDAYGMMGNVAFVLHDEPAYLDHARTAIHRRLR